MKKLNTQATRTALLPSDELHLRRRDKRLLRRQFTGKASTALSPRPSILTKAMSVGTVSPA